MTPEERTKSLLEHFEIIKKANREGYAGCLPNGNLVDRRNEPKAYPVAENSMFGITKPRCIQCGNVANFEELKDSICAKCRHHEIKIQ